MNLQPPAPDVYRELSPWLAHTQPGTYLESSSAMREPRGVHAEQSYPPQGTLAQLKRHLLEWNPCALIKNSRTHSAERLLSIQSRSLAKYLGKEYHSVQTKAG